jgi:hypothetical protein
MKLALLSVLWLPLAHVLASGAVVPDKVKTLDEVLSHVELKDGAEGFGGATIEDAVVLLRRMVGFPVCLELREFSRDTDGLTLDAAIEQLNALRTKQGLTPMEESQLKRYEELVAKKGRSAVIGFRKETFTLVEDNVTVHALLDRLTTLDSLYTWKNDGTAANPVVVIQPKQKSALDWAVSPICGQRREQTSATVLYGSGGGVTQQLQEHNISRVQMSDRNKVPDVQLDLCADHLTARDVLNLTVKAAGDEYSWSLSGIKGLRWLSFQ